MALDARAFPGVASEVRLKSSASTPSLRSRNSEVVSTPGRNTPDNGGGNVKVVVRVRGFLPRENQRGAQCLVEMDPKTQMTKLLVPGDSDPANSKTQSRKILEEKSFMFDNSFWSHKPDDSHYAEQEDIYNALGEEFLDHNFEGYHTCIFAYGQTGSGKSYTMMGTATQPGIIPRTCEDLFERIEANDLPDVSYTVRVNYFEVYNEHVRDLLAKPRSGQAHGPSYLKIREDPINGPYPQGLTEVSVRNYSELLRYMKQGDNARTVASTKMNDTSSRSHAVFTITLKQIHHDFETDSTTERLARIRLVDLAGSERAKATEAKGQRLREGSNINKSLTTLGRVIAALADPKHARSHNGAKTRSKDVVPYRDSVLTWLLKDSLGGNSKTAMVACIAPSDYDETLSTLRYADQAKHIRTRAVVNEDSTTSEQRDAQIESMQVTIRELQQQVVNAQTAADDYKAATSMNIIQNDKNRDERLSKYQEEVDKMQRVMEEERMLAEMKVRQLAEQNEALQRHLALAVEELQRKNEESKKTQETLRELQAQKASQDSIEVKKRHSLVDDEDKENSHPNQPKSQPRIVSIESVPESETDAEQRSWNGPASAAEDLQSDASELFEALGMFRRKMADDRTRFGFSKREPLRPSVRAV